MYRCKEISPYIQGEIWIIETSYKWFCCRKSEACRYLLLWWWWWMMMTHDVHFVWWMHCTMKNLGIWKSLFKNCFGGHPECILNRFYFDAYNTIFFLIVKSYKCSVSPKGWVLCFYYTLYIYSPQRATFFFSVNYSSRHRKNT